MDTHYIYSAISEQSEPTMASCSISSALQRNVLIPNHFHARKKKLK